MIKKRKKLLLVTASILILASLFSTLYLIRPTIETKVLDNTGDCVVLIHGFLRLPTAMENMAQFLNTSGYKTINVDYNSKYDTETISKKFLEPAISKYCPGSEEDKKIHFVTHSMGGLILRQYLKNNQPENLGRIVMIAPPNSGSELADFLNNSKITELLLGPAISELSTKTQTSAPRIDIPNIEIGIIAGTKNQNPITGLIIQGENDGKVSIENTKLENMSDFIKVPLMHTFMTDDETVQQYTLNFLQNGKFQSQASL